MFVYNNGVRISFCDIMRLVYQIFKQVWTKLVKYFVGTFFLRDHSPNGVGTTIFMGDKSGNIHLLHLL